MRSNKVMDQMSPRGKALARVGGGGRLWLSETELRSKFAIGEAQLECVSMCLLCAWVRGGCSPGKFLNLSLLKWLELHLRLI